MSKCERVIDILRKAYPGTWTFDRQMYRWCGPFDVQAYSESAATNEYDTDSRFRTTYRRTDTQQLIPELLRLSWSRVYYV